MSGNQFEDKAAKLLNRLNSTTQPLNSKSKVETSKVTAQELIKLKQQLQYSDLDTRKKMKGLNDTIRKLEGSLVEESQVRAQKEQSFGQTVIKLQKNMRIALGNVQRGFGQRQKKLQQKMDILIKNERKDLEMRVSSNDELIQNMESLQAKIGTIVDQVVSLKRARTQLEDRINHQFTQQLRQLKKIFQSDIRAREQRQTKIMQVLKGIYKGGMQRIYVQQREREQSERMLMAVVEQLVDHIIQI